ncbi:MAG: hypothetical protein V8S33_03610 [Intestinibacter bartlettii]
MPIEVTIEEVLSKTIKIEVPKEIEELDRLNYVEQKIKEMYDNSGGKSILSSEDFKGYVQIQCEANGTTTEWYSLF